MTQEYDPRFAAQGNKDDADKPIEDNAEATGLAAGPDVEVDPRAGEMVGGAEAARPDGDPVAGDADSDGTDEDD